jgi:RHS repeat-associated protein
MKQRGLYGQLLAIGIMTLLWAASSADAKPVPSAAHSAAIPGDSITLLPDGHILIAGGQAKDGSLLRDAILQDTSTGTSVPLSASLNIARAWHTATVLPDGTVLILGGIGNDGKVVPLAELFDPQTQTFQLLASSPGSRAFHSATLLTDGQVFIAGGVSSSGAVLQTVELWNPRTKKSVIPQARLTSPRRNHDAALLADGRVLLQGGKDGNSNPNASADVYDPDSQTVSRMTAQPPLTATSITEARATSPEDNAVDVPVDALIAIRFSEPLLIQTINSEAATLSGSGGAVQAKVVGAEGGMLAFVIPAANLLPGTEYSVSFSGAVDLKNSTVAPKEFTFTTAGDAGGDSDEWAPTSDWQTHRGPSKWQSLPPLKAPPGVTALAGQVLKLDGNPLRHVTLMIDGGRAFTDDTGRFLLQNLKPGHHSMLIIASSANTALRTYGIYEVGVDITARITNVLRYTIWQTPLDTARTVTIPSPTLSETVIRSPLLPGLELHIPAHTVITGYDGKVVTQINVTPIPLDRPPFPLPNVQVPIYFTIQPGSAYISVKAKIDNGPKGARLFYPNAYNYPPGTPYSFWNYDPDQKGWFIYGAGKVSADRSQVIPNPGVVIYELTGAMVSQPSNAPTCPCPRGVGRQDPIDIGTGLFVYNKTDLAVNDTIPLVLSRAYRPNDPASRSFGIGSNDSFDFFMIGDNELFPEGYTYQDLILPDGARIHFQRISACQPSGYCSFGDAVYQNTSGGTDFFGAIIRYAPCERQQSSWTLTKNDGTVFCFPDSDHSTSYRNAAPLSITDRYGNKLVFTRDTLSNLTQITSPNGRFIQFTYDASNRITQAKDNINRTVTYSYDTGGRLSQVTDANGGVWKYTYDANNNMLTIQDPRGIFFLSNQYDANNRVIQQTGPDNQNSYFSYTTDQYGNVTQTNITDPRGIVEQAAFDSNGYLTSDIFAVGKPEQQTITYTRDPNTELATAIVDPLGRETDVAYDASGNVTGITRLAHTANAVSTSFAYDPTFNQVTTITDPLSHVTTFSYDASGGLSSITDPLGHKTTFAINSVGQIATVTDANQNTTQFSYNGGDLVGITDPSLNTTARFLDGVGRLASVTNALGRTTRFSYNPLDQILQITDPLQGNTSFTYDLNGNLLTVQDANQGTTAYTYNDHDMAATKTDPLQRTEIYTYDANEDLVTFTDRKGQVTTYAYDNLNRLNFVGFGTQGNNYASTISYQYDAGNRMTQATDSISGVIGRGYDGLDRLTSETTPQGSITYTYDNATRRATMQVAGQSQVGYTFDTANRLTQIAQGTSTVGFTYDNANRRSTLTLPNGIVATYSYDNDSHLTGIAYSLNSTSVGSLTYGYDALGMRNSATGSFARTGLPQPIPSATYDAANQLLAWNELAPSYDSNGNMLSDGTHNYAWDARNHLSTIDSGSTGSFVYDPAGRRATKVISGAATNFLYDFANPVQELSGTTPTASLLGGAVDQYFTRTDSNWTASFLVDGLGGTVALADPTGTLQTQYTYGPFGAKTAQVGATSNSLTYTGREDDNTGLYYYRARYYSPALQRFLAEDPLGIDGGINMYSYAADNPISLRDPFGLQWDDFWNNPIADFISSHADYINGICEGGAFQYAGGGPQVGGGFGGVYGFDNVSISYKGPDPSLDYHQDPLSTLVEGGLDVPGGEVGYGRVYGRKGMEDQFVFVGAGAHAPKRFPNTHLHLGPLVGLTPDGNRIIGLFGDVGYSRDGGHVQGAYGGGFYLVVEPASQCIQ